MDGGRDSHELGEQPSGMSHQLIVQGVTQCAPRVAREFILLGTGFAETRQLCRVSACSRAACKRMCKMSDTLDNQQTGLTRLCDLAFTHWQRSRVLLAIQSLLVIVSLLVGGVLVLVALSGWRTVMRQQIVQRGGVLSRLLAETALPKLLEADSARLQELLLSVEGERHLVEATLTDRSGQPVASLRRVQLPEALPSTALAATGGFFFTKGPEGNNELVVFLHPIDSSARTEGHLRLVMAGPGWMPFSLSDRRSAAIGISIIGTLLFFGTYAAGRTLRPVYRLAEVIGGSRCSEGFREMPVEHVGEFSDVARGWNQMVGQFERVRQEMQETNRRLQLRSGLVQYEKKQIETLLDELPDGIVVIDADGKVSRFTQGAARLLGVNAERALGQNAAEALPMLAEIVRNAAQPTSGHRVEEVVLQHGETPVALQVMVRPLNQSNGRDELLVAIREVTQAKAEEQARNDFVATVTHELRTPLTNIRSYLELITEDGNDSVELRKEFFNVVNAETDRLQSLISNLLNISKIEMGGYVAQRSPIKTQKLIEQIVSSVEPQATSKSIRLEVRLPEKLPDLEADKEMIQVVLMNLLSNGLKYTDSGGTVVLSVEEQNNELLIHITDTGCGIPEEDLPKLFQKFYRGRNAASKAAGSGLGLALSRQIARLHGGDLRVHSRVGEGTRVTLVLPKKPEETLEYAQV